MGQRVIKDHFREVWQDIFEISSESPSGLAWKTTRGTAVKAGTACGWQSNTGHWKVEYKSKGICVHRVVFYLTYGFLTEGLVIDHIDGDSSNNSPENLREVSFAVNMRNKKLQTNNLSGCSGVHEVHRWVAAWREQGEIRQKSFRVCDYNGDSEAAKQSAITFRQQQINRLNGLGYGYTERHGDINTQ